MAITVRGLYRGDCMEVMRGLESDSVDALVTDPPAGIGFMGKEWDSHSRDGFMRFITSVMKECLRVLKPGGHGLVWAIPRTSHWTGMALEDAGFEVRDCVYHVFGSGFPKSLNLGNGRGTALKPAVECWWLIRKPISEKTIAENVLKWGTGGFNIDACRIPLNGDRPREGNVERSESVGYGVSTWQKSGTMPPQGRFPSHLIHDGSDEVVALFPNRASGRPQGVRHTEGGYGKKYGSIPVTGFGDSGSASRFFYCAKASRSERNMGCEGFEEKPSYMVENGSLTAGRNGVRYERTTRTRNHHPTVKPIALMEYLIKLITPPKGTVLDPFMGSGSTGVAAKKLGFSFIGIEKEEEYFKIAEARINATQGCLL